MRRVFQLLDQPSNWYFKNFDRYLRHNHQRLGLPDVYGFDVMYLNKREAIDHNAFNPTLSTDQAKQILTFCKERIHTRSQFRD